ncbi:UpxY family transcription antiterminator [Fibrella aquatilis]|uniref:UpxY family transcription antiterminator n=1 Tax=Fibrella aquatilis TaxID=2817059 RepID=A0A939G7F7_9BACT|nr:UpxY family transcription antiterminator [Fibrella aquatilis]MBO0933589.1 UpxY family transcription antiterminator [Fibrella aquatilis]
MNITAHSLINSAMAQPEWYAVYTYPKAERKVYEKISRMNVEAFLPMHKVIRQWSDRKKKMEVPLFPNYVFVKTTPNLQFELCQIKELVRFITFEKKPVCIPEGVISSIKKITLGDIEVSDHTLDYKLGQQVEVVQGQFAGIRGYLVNIKGKNRLVICIEALQSLVSVEISASCVMPQSK